jgi:para-nitrobenzyl esterase
MLKNRRHTTAMVTVASLVLALTATAAAQSDDTRVTIDAGRIEGAVSGDVLSFKGIPYAAPPVGAWRWRAPQPVTPWRGVRPATAYGHDCMQQPIPGDAAASGGAFGEDCLFVNVWRPAATRPGAALPVLVWIHGGGFLNGGSSAPMFDGSALARQGLVVVAINYRLGRLGFFMHPALTATGEDAPGNYGFLDQLAALQWVRRNIGAFGGDAQQVTIAGESAGGISVLHHLTWPAAAGVFHRAVVMSGGGRTYLVAGTGAVPPARAEHAGLAFAHSRGIPGTGADALAALRALPVEQVNGDLSMEALLTKPNTYAGGPILDGKIAKGMPSEVLRKRAAARVPVLIGTTSDELPVLSLLPRDNPLSFFGAEAPAAKAVYFAGAADPVAVIKNIAADMTMHEPARSSPGR